MNDETSSAKESDEPSSDSNSEPERSYWPIFVVTGIIVFGTLGWTLLTVTTVSDIQPTRSKELAETFEKECILFYQDPRRCKKLTGKHHRTCLLAAEVDAPSTSEVKRDEQTYLSCMKRKTGITESNEQRSSDSSDEGRGDERQ